MKKLIPLLMALVLTPLLAVAGDKFPDISHEELTKAIKEEKVTVIDVNGTESYKEGHIPGAIDFAANEEKLESMLPKEKDALVVAYCGNEKCQAYKSAAKKAEELGYTNVKHYSGGLAGWKESGAELEKPKS